MRRISFTCSNEIKDKLEELANQESRSVSSLIAYMIDEYLNNESFKSESEKFNLLEKRVSQNEKDIKLLRNAIDSVLSR